MKAKCLLLIALVVCLAGAVMAQGSADSQSPTGAWSAVVTSPFGPMRALMTFGRDGTLIVSQAALVPMGPGTTWVFSDAHGAWKHTAGGQITFQFVSLLHDMNATFVGTSAVSATCSIDTAGKLNCNCSAADLLADGTPLFGFKANLAAVRITAD